MLRALKLKRPRWFIAHRDISIARQLLKQYMILEDESPNPAFAFKNTEILDDIRLVKLYNDVILNDIEPADRVGHWVDEFFRIGDILRVIQTQFAGQERVRAIVEQMKQQVQ